MIPEEKSRLHQYCANCAMFTHDKDFHANKKFIDEVNRYIRFSTHDYFVTHDGRSDQLWFEERGLPADAWENTEEGKAAMVQAERYRKMREQYEAEKRASGKAEDRSSLQGLEPHDFTLQLGDAPGHGEGVNEKDDYDG